MFQPDLDDRLHFASGLVALTDRRLLAPSDRKKATAPSTNGDAAAARDVAGNGVKSQWQSWPLAEDQELRIAEHGGIGEMELLSVNARLGSWRFTAAASAAARRFEARWTAERSKRSAGSNGASHVNTVCPSCGEVITTDDGVCAACANVTPPPPVSSLFRLLAFARPHAWPIVLGFILTLASNLMALIPPIMVMLLIRNVLKPLDAGEAASPTLVYMYLAGMFGAALMAWLLNWPRLYVTAWVSERISSDLRRKTYSHLQQLSLEYFGGKRTGDLMSRISTDTERICNFLSLNLVDIVNDTITVAMTTAILFYMNAQLAVATLLPFPLIVWLTYRARERLKHGFSQSSVAAGHLNSVLADTIPGIRVVKAFAQESREIERFDEADKHLFDVNNGLNVFWAFFVPLVSMLTSCGLLCVWALGAWRAFHSPIGVDVLVLFVSYIGPLYTRMESMIRFVSNSQRAAASAQRIFEILDRVPSVPEPVKPVHPGRLEGRVELRSVRFKYGSREVLHGLDLQIEPGEMIGLVGPSGAGKSTLINLICRFFDVAEGAILVDGFDIRSFPVREYRKNIGIVLQDPFLFYGTVAENIAYGRPDATRAEIVAAARAARAHEFILQLADGYDSVVGERGQSLSGGERQRISIARALLIDPRLLILDEATSSVDTETEREIQIALENLTRGRTTIAIAHRLSTLRRADRLVVVERGRIAEIGKHADLIREHGAYSRLHRAQMELTHGIGV